MVDTRTMNENTDDFLKIVSYLSSMNITMSEEVLVILLLNPLPSRFNALKETLKYRKDTLSLEDVMSAARSKDKILQEAWTHQKDCYARKKKYGKDAEADVVIDPDSEDDALCALMHCPQ
ncbi:hypothetical protein Bca4012_083156 [Brassica carinata]